MEDATLKNSVSFIVPGDRALMVSFSIPEDQRFWRRMVTMKTAVYLLEMWLEPWSDEKHTWMEVNEVSKYYHWLHYVYTVIQCYCVVPLKLYHIDISRYRLLKSKQRWKGWFEILHLIQKNSTFCSQKMGSSVEVVINQSAHRWHRPTGYRFTEVSLRRGNFRVLVECFEPFTGVAEVMPCKGHLQAVGGNLRMRLEGFMENVKENIVSLVWSF